MTKINKKQYITNVRVMNYLLQAIPNDIYNLVDACKTAQEMWERIKRLMYGFDITNHDGRVDIQTKNAGYGGNGTDSNPGKANVQYYNCNEKGHYARDCQKPRVHDAKYFREQMLLALKDEAGSNLKDEENVFMLDNSYRDETLKEIIAAAIMMAQI
ncbi:reverse transcriptase domain-containing protein [Tanacetum coccineum]